jgi:hypothetical protein
MGYIIPNPSCLEMRCHTLQIVEQSLCKCRQTLGVRARHPFP